MHRYPYIQKHVSSINKTEAPNMFFNKFSIIGAGVLQIEPKNNLF